MKRIEQLATRGDLEQVRDDALRRMKAAADPQDVALFDACSAALNSPRFSPELAESYDSFLKPIDAVIAYLQRHGPTKVLKMNRDLVDKGFQRDDKEERQAKLRSLRVAIKSHVTGTKDARIKLEGPGTTSQKIARLIER